MEYQDFDRSCIELLNELPKRQSRHCFKSALNHLERAEILFPIDSAMAVFRCLTAEEEAATGLMYCLKDKRYKNADKLKPKCHVQKNAVIQFYSILCQFAEDHFREFDLDTHLSIVETEKRNKIVFHFYLNFGNGLTQYIPEPPLNFKLMHDDKRFSYKEQIETLVKSKEMNGISELVKTTANQRNLLLYASQKGFPAEAQVEDKFFPAYQKRVMSLLRTYLMIAPYESHQSFVQDGLDAFISMLNKHNFDDLHDLY